MFEMWHGSRILEWLQQIQGPRHSWSGQSLSSHRGGPGSRSGLASGICGGQSGVEAGFLLVLPLPKPLHSTNFSITTITRGS
jgi:hypothetical protein